MSYATSLNQGAAVKRYDRCACTLGWGISVLAHVLAGAWLWHAWLPPRMENDAAPVKRIEVWLVPAAPKPVPASAPEAAIPRTTRTPAHAAAGPAAPRRQPSADVVPAAPTVTIPEPEAAAASTGADVPAVDLVAARAAARRIAREDAKGLVALPQRKPVVDPNGDHHVVDPLERARRVDCQTARGQSTNLLANVVMLAKDMVANAIDDSGCKW